ncbi:MAG: 50S ribosomal protein L18 [Lentisphaeria bacterium]
MAKLSRKLLRARRHQRLRRRTEGSAAVPRMSVNCSQKHFYIQFIDDAKGETLAAASSQDPELKDQIKPGKVNVDTAVKVAEIATDRAKKANISKAVFDRGGFKYHGRVKAAAETVRKAGLEL